MSTKLYFAVGLFLFSLHALASESIEIKAAWIPEAPPVARMHAGYLQVKNNSTQAIVIVTAQSADYDAVEIHKTETRDGMARMIEQKEISIPAGKEVNFERGGLHLMLMQPRRKLKVGDQAEIKFVTKDKQTVTFTAKVKAATLDEHDHSHHHH